MNGDSRISQSSPSQAIAQIADAARRESTLRKAEGKQRRLPAGREKPYLIEDEVGETDRAFREILGKIAV
jgi:hypothetical protein